MSRENAELVRRLQLVDVDLVALVKDDAMVGAMIETLGPFFDPGFECEIVLPFQRERYSGLPGLRAAWRDWLEPWESYRAEIEDVIDAGEAAVVLTRDYGRHPGMEAEVRLLGPAVWTVRNGKVVRAEFHTDRNAALEAAGLSE